MTTTETPQPTPVAEAPVTPEVVEPVDASPLAPATIDRQTAATELIHAAADAALMPGVPGRDEFITLAMTARILSMSGAAPEAVRNNPYIAFHVALVGRDLDLSPSAALNLIDVIDGKKGPQLSLSPQLLNGRIQRLGLGQIVKAASSTASCYAIAVGPGGEVDMRCRRSWPDHAEGCSCHGVIGEAEFTWEDARMAGLVGPGCDPGAHDPACISWTKGKSCNQGYKTYPKRMLWWRAAGFCADDWFPTASMGLYSPEALGATVDDEGRPIDPATVTLPDGYEPAAPEPVEMANADTVADFRRRVAALPAACLPALGEAWRNGLDGTHEGRYLRSLGKDGAACHLQQNEVKRAAALIAHFEQRAAGGEWGDWTPPPSPPETDPPAGGLAPDGLPANPEFHDDNGENDPPTTEGDAPSAAAPPEGSEEAAGSAGSAPPAAAPSAPQEPVARVGVPQPPAAPTASETPASEASCPSCGAPRPDLAPGSVCAACGHVEPGSERCPVCAGSGMAAGEPCWSPECTAGAPAAHPEACVRCGTVAAARVVAGGESRCIDEDACWEREQAANPEMARLAAEAEAKIAAGAGDTIDLPSRELPSPGQTDVYEDDPALAPSACPLCHSARSKLVWVPPTHSEDHGTWRCQNASACKERVKGKSGVDVARAALAAAEAKS